VGHNIWEIIILINENMRFVEQRLKIVSYDICL